MHLPQLVDGAVPSDMALSTPAGLDEEQRLFYVAVTRARDRLNQYAPLRMHHHRMATDDRLQLRPADQSSSTVPLWPSARSPRQRRHDRSCFRRLRWR